MDEYVQANKRLWDALTGFHLESDYYDVQGFKSGKLSLKSLEIAELGSVRDKSLLHLQCAFGLDTLSWARLGAKATGVDFSEESISAARAISREIGVEADFICSTVYELPKVLSGGFDIAFTSYGVLVWLPDLARWAEVIAHFLKPGGTFYMVEHHPYSWILDESGRAAAPVVKRSYFDASAQEEDYGSTGSYASGNAQVPHRGYEWPHTLGEVITSLAAAGLRIEFVHEFRFSDYQSHPYLVKGEDGWWRFPEGWPEVPLMFSIRATK